MPPCTNHIFVYMCKNAPNTAPRAKLFVYMCKNAPNTAPRAKRAQSNHSYSSTSVHATHLKVIYKSALPILESEPISFACGKAHGSGSRRPSTSSGSSADLRRTTPNRVRQSPTATKMHPATAPHANEVRLSCIGDNSCQCLSFPSINASHVDKESLLSSSPPKDGKAIFVQHTSPAAVTHNTHQGCKLPSVSKRSSTAKTPKSRSQPLLRKKHSSKPQLAKVVIMSQSLCQRANNDIEI